MEFNSDLSKIMHVDINSCFATIEQQANPLLRGKPLVVAAFPTPRGCILAASIEAKKFGIKTGMRVFEGKALYPKLVVLPPDPWKYRSIHLRLRNLIAEYTNDFSPKSIDEFVLNMSDYLALKANPLKAVAREIKQRIKNEIGEWITVSIGIAPNRYLAKIAAGLHKPDGLDEINRNNFLEIYSSLKLTDLTGIKERNAIRLGSVGIKNVLDFYEAPIWKLKAAFRSIAARYWHARLRGYEVDDVEFERRSYGNSIAIGAKVVSAEEIAPILSNLVEKMSARMRAAGYLAHGVHLFVSYKDGTHWHHGELTGRELFDSRDIFKCALRIASCHPFGKPVRNIAVSVFDLAAAENLQLDFFENIEKKESLIKTADSINKCYGDFTIKPGRMLAGRQKVLDRIAFGGIKELEEFATASRDL